MQIYLKEFMILAKFDTERWEDAVEQFEPHKPGLQV